MSSGSPVWLQTKTDKFEMKKRSNHGRTGALRVKVFSIEVKKNAGAGLGQERYEYLTEIHREYNAEKRQPD